MLSAVFPESWDHSSDAVDGVCPPDGATDPAPDPDAEGSGVDGVAEAVGVDGVDAVGAGVDGSGLKDGDK